ncbi:hypothetical protein C8F04DRAFT_1101509 [Mycena alexandri]|uniref:Uncharacterized protein n=1 Tax=Mycena alexandri TaxID=1745969 RepID=A0AAD6SW96_9AGAR|nr:hypothetical protein C8F04DRAFT_1101509 [Mycena alexandri]
MIGTLPPREGIQLYMARVDPHLISGCEVALDVISRLVKKLEKPQLRFLRRLLGLNPRSMRAVLFTETGLLPIRYRRAIIVLKHAKYWAHLTDDHYAHAAYMESLRLSSQGHVSWAADLRTVLGAFPIPVALPESALESAETYLLRKRLERDNNGNLRTVVLRFRNYLRIVSVPHRKAFTRFLLSDHSLSVEALRHTDRYRKYKIPRVWRLCRFCQMEVEDETHAALVCTGHPELSPLRADFLRDVFALRPALQSLVLTQPAEDFLACLLLDQAVTSRMARYVFNVLQIYETREMWVPPEHFNLIG